MSKIIKSDKGFIHISLMERVFYRSSNGQRHKGCPLVHGFMAGGEVDLTAFEEEVQILSDNGFKEVPNPMRIEVQLQYFKKSGKWYSEGSLFFDMPNVEEYSQSWYNVMEMIRKLMKTGELPGLVKGTKEFDVYVSGEGHPGGYPNIFKAE